MYIATLLGQRSLIFTAEAQGLLMTAFDAEMHTGTWQFAVKACLTLTDRYINIDCDPGQNLVNLEFILCVDLEDSSQYTEC